MTVSGERLAIEELRTLFLFESLDEEKLGYIHEHGRVQRLPAGADIFVEGEEANCFYVLLDGTVSLTRLVQGDRVEISRTAQRGAYGGATQSYLNEQRVQTYLNGMRAISDVTLLVLPAEVISTAMRRWFPMAMHLLDGLFLGMRTTQTVVGERERLLALGSLSAGLTHELNNPAAAAVRATSVLRDRVAGMRHKLAMIADGRLDGAKLQRLVELQEAAVKQAASAPALTPLETSDAEDALSDWLDEHDITGSWDLAPTLTAGGIDVAWLEQVTPAVRPEDLEPAIRWLTYTVETELLLGEIDDALGRITGLVGAAKQYSQLDRAPHRTVDVHDLLDATLAMFNTKIRSGVRVVKEYDRGLPPIPVYAAELNQVWTNLIDNALYAIGEEGVLTVRTGRDADSITVDIVDTGPGIPAEVRSRIFEPFFTTKPIGDGTGLGLDISYRIVVNKHHGDIRVDSEPGHTVIRVCLPIPDPDAVPEAGVAA
ncbi:ATP-binding protein [Plantactinospora sp. WMMC1484]|uniref:ATP-binding protein n=1 Tax=Plantactinospora sp. WMMC1484 TaxID=3404122 RepID=UPI003BF462DC